MQCLLTSTIYRRSGHGKVPRNCFRHDIWELWPVATVHIVSNYLHCHRNAAPFCTEAMDTGLGTSTLATDPPRLPTSGPARVALPAKRSAFSIDNILTCGRVFPICSTPSVSLSLPNGFWDGGDTWFTPELQQQLELDLTW